MDNRVVINLTEDEKALILARAQAAKTLGFSKICVDFAEGRIVSLSVTTSESHKTLKKMYLQE